MDGRHVDALLVPYDEETLAAHERDAVEAHLTGCERCRARLRRLRDGYRAVAALGSGGRPADLTPAVLARLDSQRAWPLPRPLAAVALLGVLLAAVLAYPPARAQAAGLVRSVFGVAGYMGLFAGGGGDDVPGTPNEALERAVEAVRTPGTVFYTEMTEGPIQENDRPLQERELVWFDAERGRARIEFYEDGRLQSVTVYDGRQKARYFTQSGRVDVSQVEELPDADEPALWMLPYLTPWAMSGTVVLEGINDVDGRRVLHVRAEHTVDEPEGDFPAGITWIHDIFLDAASLLPVRQDISARAPGDPEVHPVFRFDFSATQFLDRDAVPPGHLSPDSLQERSREGWREMEDFDQFPLFWLGDSFAGHTLSGIVPSEPPAARVDTVTFLYGTCDPPCAVSVSIHVQSVCKVPPEQVVGSNTRATVRGEALALWYPGKVILWTGDVMVDVNVAAGLGLPQPGEPDLTQDVIRQLRGYGRNTVGPGEPLPPPDFERCRDLPPTPVPRP